MDFEKLCPCMECSGDVNGRDNVCVLPALRRAYEAGKREALVAHGLMCSHGVYLRERCQPCWDSPENQELQRLKAQARTLSASREGE